MTSFVENPLARIRRARQFLISLIEVQSALLCQGKSGLDGLMHQMMMIALVGPPKVMFKLGKRSRRIRHSASRLAEHPSEYEIFKIGNRAAELAQAILAVLAVYEVLETAGSWLAGTLRDPASLNPATGVGFMQPLSMADVEVHKAIISSSPQGWAVADPTVLDAYSASMPNLTEGAKNLAKPMLAARLAAQAALVRACDDTENLLAEILPFAEAGDWRHFGAQPRLAFRSRLLDVESMLQAAEKIQKAMGVLQAMLRENGHPNLAQEVQELI